MGWIFTTSQCIEMELRIYCFIFCIIYCYSLVSENAHIARILIGTVSFDEDGTTWHKEWQLGIEEKSAQTKNCSLFLTGTLVTSLEHEMYWYSGNGRIRFGGDNGAIFHCVYITVTGAEVNHQYDIPNTLNIALSCMELVASDPQSPSVCQQQFFKQKDILLTVEVYPDKDLSHLPPQEPEHSNKTSKIRHWQPQNVHYLKNTFGVFPLPNRVTQTIAVSRSSQLNTPFLYSAFGDYVDYSKAPVGARAVCTVQTFRNAMSGPMLYMFIQHHVALGWVVIIYDRYGWHEEVVKEFINANKTVLYHPYTLLQYYFPDIYDKDMSRQQSSEFMYYSRRGAHGFPDGLKHILGNNSEANDDADRRKTYMHARQLYAHLSSVLYVDRDEFIYCPRAHDSLIGQSVFQKDYFDRLRQRGIHGLEIARFAHAAVHPRPGTWNGNNMNIFTSLCMASAYTSRNMSALWACWTEVSIRNTKFKSGDIGTGRRCPFYGVHDVCLRCNCKRELSGRCRLLHLNNVYFKPKMVEEKGKLMFRPYDMMLNMWT